MVLIHHQRPIKVYIRHEIDWQASVLKYYQWPGMVMHPTEDRCYIFYLVGQTKVYKYNSRKKNKNILASLLSLRNIRVACPDSNC